MKLYIKASVGNLQLLLQAIKQFNADSDSHITLNKDKTAYRYSSYERDLYQFGRISDLLNAFDAALESQNFDIAESLSEALDTGKSEWKGAHHAFQVSDLRDWVKSKNAEYGFNVISSDEGVIKAEAVYAQILELCEEHQMLVTEPRSFDSLKSYGMQIQPKLRQVKITAGYSGLAEDLVGRDWADRKQFIQMLKDNTPYIIESTGIQDFVVNDRSGSVTFHY